MQIVTLQCPTCKAPLQFEKDQLERDQKYGTCSFCGTTYYVRLSENNQIRAEKDTVVKSVSKSPGNSSIRVPDFSSDLPLSSLDILSKDRMQSLSDLEKYQLLSQWASAIQREKDPEVMQRKAEEILPVFSSLAAQFPKSFLTRQDAQLSFNQALQTCQVFSEFIHLISHLPIAGSFAFHAFKHYENILNCSFRFTVQNQEKPTVQKLKIPRTVKKSLCDQKVVFATLFNQSLKQEIQKNEQIIQQCNEQLSSFEKSDRILLKTYECLFLITPFLMLPFLPAILFPAWGIFLQFLLNEAVLFWQFSFAGTAANEILSTKLKAISEKETLQNKKLSESHSHILSRIESMTTTS